MNRKLIAALVALAGCGPIQSYPLAAPPSGARATFDPLLACAQEQKLQAVKHPDSVNVHVEGGAWVQFMDQAHGFHMVVVGAADPGAAEAAKHQGDAIYACATARVAAAGGAPPPAAATPAAPPPAANAPAAPAASGAARAPGKGGPLDGFGKALGGAMGQIGKGVGTMAVCTQATTCLSAVMTPLCLGGTDKPCMDAFAKAHEHGPKDDECRKAITRVVATTEKYKSRVPDWKLPDVCKQ